MRSKWRRTLRRILSAIAVPAIVSLATAVKVTCGVIGQVHILQPTVGSSDDYIREQHAGLVRNVPELGMEVSEGGGALASGGRMRGIRVVRVIPEGPAGRAGLKDQQVIGKTTLAGALLAGGMIFPPALFVGIAVVSSDILDWHDTIVAVDSQRTRNVQELEDAIARAREAPILYLSVVRNGRLNQITIFLPTAIYTTE